VTGEGKEPPLGRERAGLVRRPLAAAGRGRGKSRLWGPACAAASRTSQEPRGPGCTTASVRAKEPEGVREHEGAPAGAEGGAAASAAGTAGREEGAVWGAESPGTLLPLAVLKFASRRRPSQVSVHGA
jgi:hypothetical protein